MNIITPGKTAVLITIVGVLASCARFTDTGHNTRIKGDDSMHSEVRELVKDLKWRKFNVVEDGLVVDAKTAPVFDHEITVEALINSDDYPAEHVQSIISQWAFRKDMTRDAFAAYDAGQTSGLDSKGYLGVVFDGRYVYYSPQANSTPLPNGQRRHGVALRYDTHMPFTSADAWEAYDAGHTDGLTTRGYYGAVFDGRYVYYVPRFDGYDLHSRILRFDSHASFTDPKAWSAFDAGLDISSQSAGFDGRYIYFAPGAGRNRKTSGRIAWRYDTTKPFKEAASYEKQDVGDTAGLKTQNFDGVVFDGRYIYYVPLGNNMPLRYDTQGDFHAESSWSAFDGSSVGMKICVGGIFDGRYVYYVPYSHNTVVRFDTRSDFTDRNAWTVFDGGEAHGMNTKGFDGAVFDGRYIYFVPFYAGGKSTPERFHGVVLRYDATQPFDNATSWAAINAGNTDGLSTKGYNGAAFDGRYIYFAPWNRGEGEGSNIRGHGCALRYDTTANGAVFSLRCSDIGHNGGLCAAVPGPRFIVNTDRGAISASADKTLTPGTHHLVGTYDGKDIRLFIDGELVGQQSGAGRIARSDEPITIGRLADGLGAFQGQIGIITVSDKARNAEWIKKRFTELRADGFHGLTP